MTERRADTTGYDRYYQNNFSGFEVLKPEEFEAATAGNITDRSQKLDSLQSQYKELEEHYLHVLERIDCY